LTGCIVAARVATKTATDKCYDAADICNQLIPIEQYLDMLYNCHNSHRVTRIRQDSETASMTTPLWLPQLIHCDRRYLQWFPQHLGKQ
jgi:hypothetical protein